jgi:hypothetical protein
MASAQSSPQMATPENMAQPVMNSPDEPPAIQPPPPAQLLHQATPGAPFAGVAMNQTSASSISQGEAANGPVVSNMPPAVTQDANVSAIPAGSEMPAPVIPASSESASGAVTPPASTAADANTSEAQLSARISAMQALLQKDSDTIDKLETVINDQQTAEASIVDQVSNISGTLGRMSAASGDTAKTLAKLTSPEDGADIGNRDILTNYHLLGVSSHGDLVQGPNGRIKVKMGSTIPGAGLALRTIPYMATSEGGSDYQSWQIVTSTGRIVP